MSTNATNEPHQFVTVAELVARERGEAESYRSTNNDCRSRALTPAAELLHREGVTVGATDTQPMHVARLLHVAKLLHREGQTGALDHVRKPRRAAAIGSAAGLCGLTIAGLIALKPASLATGGMAAPRGGMDDNASQIAESKDTADATVEVLKRVTTPTPPARSVGGSSGSRNPTSAGSSERKASATPGPTQVPPSARSANSATPSSATTTSADPDHYYDPPSSTSTTPTETRRREAGQDQATAAVRRP